MPSLWPNFFPSDPFAGFDPSGHPLDLQGWGSDDSVFETLIRFARPQFIVEVGSWKGASAIHMADICRRLELDTQILCVDTWLGSLEMYAERKGNKVLAYQDLAHRHGFPQLYYQFLANVMKSGHRDRICPLPLPSGLAAQLLAHLHLAPNIVYIDASHDYGSVSADLDSYSDILAEGGILFGDDYRIPAWPEVTQAADEFAESTANILWGREGKFVIVPGADARQIPGIA